jgi:predicted metal-dependent HD superfamily phosphohydrolase
MYKALENMKERFITFITPYSPNKEYPEQLWQKIENAYTASGRHYHTLAHLAKMIEVISPYEHKLTYKEAIWFAVWFHDVVYDTNQTDNEEKSAAYLWNESSHLMIPDNIVQKAIELILLTKKHSISADADFDTKLFLDADLVILGGTEQEYRHYQEGVRREYAQYPDLLYKEGRKKVLKHFLEAEPLYKTEEIRTQFENKAKINLSLELKQLS